MKKTHKAYLLLLLNAFLWGSATPIIKVGLKELSPLLFLYYRLSIASIFTVIYLIATSQLKNSIKLFKKPKNILIMFLIAPASLIIQFAGINKTTGVIASITIAFTPLITNLMGGLFNKEIITRKEKIGTTIAFIAIVVL